MLINFSNHPSDQWEQTQQKAAQQYGNVEDVPFPEISPLLNSDDINRLADEYVETLLKMYGSLVTIHVMGEMTFTYAVVTRLKAKGVHCIASTTERNAQINSNRQKISEFCFVQFREY